MIAVGADWAALAGAGAARDRPARAVGSEPSCRYGQPDAGLFSDCCSWPTAGKIDPASIAFSAWFSHSEMRSSSSGWPVRRVHIRERFLSIVCRVATSWPTRMAPFTTEWADGFPATKYLSAGTSVKMTLTKDGGTPAASQ